MAIGLASVFVSLLGAAAAFDYPAGVDVWCGKAYRATNASFNPGGWLEDPTASSEPLLNLQVRPRLNLYIEGESFGSFIVDASISHIHGVPIAEACGNSTATTLFVEIATDSGKQLVPKTPITVGTIDAELKFSLKSLTPSTTPLSIKLSVSGSNLTAETELFYLPPRTDGGSVVKLDSLHGGLLVQTSNSTNGTWAPLLPYSYYMSWDSWLELSVDNLNLLQEWGYNLIHPVPDAGLPNQAFEWDVFDEFLDRCDEIGMYLMFDMRWTYKNLTAVTEQVGRVKSRKSLLLYYTGDEPDGQTDPLNATKITYDLIKEMDPYHPVSLCLNCYNFYFEEYSSGADIILSDVYPIAVNTSYSEVYDTVCNTTYGCCGCDDCNGDFEDISSRLDLFAHYQDILNLPPKTSWGVPQAFGNETFWHRYPTGEEEAVMNILSINHGAKGIVMWDFPTTSDINSTTSGLAKALTSPAVTPFILGGSISMTLPVLGQQRIDVSAWTLGDKMLVSVVNLEYTTSTANITVTLPHAADSILASYWGDDAWKLSGNKLSKKGISGLEVDILVLSV